MLFMYVVIVVIGLAIGLPFVLAKSAKAAKVSERVPCPKCGHDALMFGDGSTGQCIKCRAKLVRAVDGNLIVR
ncbi:hypothetical protein D3C81_1810160 [compost metagenome]